MEVKSFHIRRCHIVRMYLIIFEAQSDFYIKFALLKLTTTVLTGLGKDFVESFLKRRPDIKRNTSIFIATKRQQVCTRYDVKSFFKNYSYWKSKFIIAAIDKWNPDEKQYSLKYLTQAREVLCSASSIIPCTDENQSKDCFTTLVTRILTHRLNSDGHSDKQGMNESAKVIGQ